MERLEPRRLFSAGALDARFGNAGVAPLPGGNGALQQIVPLSDGRVVVLRGNPFLAGVGSVLRYDRDGLLDFTFGGGDGVIDTPVNTALAVQPDGKILVAGASGNSDTLSTLHRYDVDGGVDATFADNGVLDLKIQAAALLVQDDGRILVGGTHFAGTSK